jgi:hypothetical protein
MHITGKARLELIWKLCEVFSRFMMEIESLEVEGAFVGV